MITAIAFILYAVAGLCAYIAGNSAGVRDMQTSGASVAAFWLFFCVASALVIWG